MLFSLFTDEPTTRIGAHSSLARGFIYYFFFSSLLPGLLTKMAKKKKKPES